MPAKVLNLNSNLKKRPAIVSGTTPKVQTGCGELFVTINRDEKGELFEVFTAMGKAGGCAAAQLEAIGRLISYALRIGGDPAQIIKQLSGIACHQPHEKVSSCADGVAKALEQCKRGNHGA